MVPRGGFEVHEWIRLGNQAYLPPRGLILAHLTESATILIAATI
jgi:hypothetical protein